MHFAWMATGQTDVPGGKLAVVTDSLTFHDPHCRCVTAADLPPDYCCRLIKTIVDTFETAGKERRDGENLEEKKKERKKNP